MRNNIGKKHQKSNSFQNDISRNLQPIYQVTEPDIKSDHERKQYEQNSMNRKNYNLSICEAKCYSEYSMNSETRNLTEVTSVKNKTPTQKNLRPGNFQYYLQRKVMERNTDCDSDSNKQHLITQDTQEGLESWEVKNHKSLSQENKAKPSKSINDQIAQLKEKLEVSEEINEWLRSQLQKITNNEDWMIYRQLFLTLDVKHKYFFKNPQKKQFFISTFKQHKLLQNLLEVAELNEQNLEAALNKKMAEYHQKEKIHLQRIEQLEEERKYLVPQQYLRESQSKLKQTNQLNQEMNQKIQNLTKSNRKLQNDQLEMQTRLNSIEEEYKIQLENQKEKIQKLEENLKNKEAYWKEIETSFINYKKKQDKIVLENRQLRAQIQELIKIKDSNTQSLRAQDILLTNLQYELDILQKNQKEEQHNQELEVKLSELQKQLGYSDQQFTEANKKCQQLQSKIKCLEMELEEARKIIQQLMEEIKKLRNIPEMNFDSDNNFIDRVYFFEQKIIGANEDIEKVNLNFEEEHLRAETLKNDTKVMVNQLDYENVKNIKLSQNLSSEINADLVQRIQYLTNQMNLLDAHFFF